MRIGILTFFGNNYGAVLQCYALQQLLLNEGHDVEIINYEPPHLTVVERIKRRIRSIDSPKQIVDFLFHVRLESKVDEADIENRRLLAQGFQNFREAYLKLTNPLEANKIGAYANQNYDAIYVGSDQVWTDLYAKELIFFMDWQPEYRGIRISYAACSAHRRLIHRRQREKIKKLLQKFNSITVRDTTTQTLVESVMGVSPDIKADPTESYDFKELQTERIIESPYMFVYVLGDEVRGGFEDAIKRIKKQVGELPVICAALSRKQKITQYADEVYYSATPTEWLNLIRYASAILTDSYHGVLFSSKFGVPCVGYIKNYIRSTRLRDLKDRRGFTNIITSSCEIDELNIFK